jgi:ABC-type lipoprotein export system ATPase subunit
MKEIACRNLCFSRTGPGRRNGGILEGVNCSFPAGEVSLITGITGAGKSTLLHLLAGLFRPTSGEVHADGVPVSRWVTAHKDLWRRKTGIVFQQPHLMMELTGLENVMLPLIPRGSSLPKIRRAGMESLERLGAAHLAGEVVSGLSGGERQKIAIGRALAVGPEALFADEPTAHQDDGSAKSVLDVLHQESGEGCIVVIVAHDHRVLESGIAKRHFTIEHGRVHEIP